MQDLGTWFLPLLVVVVTYSWEGAYGHYYHYQLAAWDSCHLSHGVCLIVGVAPVNSKLSLAAPMIVSGRTLKGVCLGGRSMTRRGWLVALMKSLWLCRNIEFKIPLLRKQNYNGRKDFSNELENFVKSILVNLIK